ncbi:MAG: Crp/Fnr family transcriptional regulator [Desulfobulbaceae bacterium]|nr:Crp/Fnr family transcriptional regulator [Desulfobulbaceae bacterium]
MKMHLSAPDLIKELDKPEHRQVRKEFGELSFARHALMFTPEHEADFVFIVKEGRVRVYLAFEDKEFSLAILKKGDIYTTHTRAFVVAFEDCTILTMPTPKFYRLMTSLPVFSRTVIGVLGELLKQSFSIIESLVFKDVTQRLVEFLLFEARNHGKAAPDGVVVRLDLTMEQLAAVVGSSRQTVSTAINEMVKSGVLQKKSRREYLVPNLDVLKGFPD